MIKNICFFSGDISRSGGTEKVACQIISGLIDKFDVSVLSLTESSQEIFFSLPDTVKRTALFQNNPSGFKQYISIVRKIRKYVKENKIDILVDIDSILDMFSVSALLNTNVKLISWEHFNFYETMGNKLRVPIRKHITKYADCVVTLTKEDKKNFQDFFGNKLRVEQIYNPIEFTQNQYQYDIRSKTIISVGRLAKQKGFDYLLEVAELVFEKHPNWQWMILGEGDERAVLEDIIQKKKISQVKLLGRVTDVEKYLEKAAMFVLTSRYEGFPLVIIEAKANNLPVISFKCKTGPAELIQNDVNGYLVECFDVKMMAEKICKLIESEELREKFSAQAILDVEKLNYESIIQQWSHLLECDI
jgi:glycosyltransferase involved in cell wall biosynthesis